MSDTVAEEREDRGSEWRDVMPETVREEWVGLSGS